MVCGLEYMMAIRLVLATDYLCVREALEALLQQEPDVHIVAHGQSGEEILHAVRQHRPDVLILPIGMPGKGGLEVLREMRQAQLPKRVVLLEACRALWSVTSGRRLAKPLAQARISYPRMILLRLVLWRLMIGGLLWRRIDGGRLRCGALKLADRLSQGAADLWKLVPSEEEQRDDQDDKQFLKA